MKLLKKNASIFFANHFSLIMLGSARPMGIILGARVQTQFAPREWFTIAKAA